MQCRSCEIILEENFKKIIGIGRAEVNHKTGIADLYYIGSQPTEEDIKRAVTNAGYKVGSPEKKPWISKDPKEYKNLLLASLILLLLYGSARLFGVFNISVNTEKTGLLVVFAVGLVAGVSTCMALVGGLVLALSARHAELHPEATAMQKFRPHLYFNLGRIGGYALFGGIIGLLGSTLRPSASLLGLMTIAVGAVMIFLGLKLVEIFPAMQNITIALPKSIARFFGINEKNKEYSHKGALFTGALTFFLPCGFTQAMQLYAISTGSFWQGAAVMSIFALGTSVGLLGIGGLSSVFTGQKAKIFFMVAGLAVILLGWVNIANGSRLLYAPAQNNNNKSVIQTGDEQVVRMTQNFDGYSPNVFTVEKGRPVKWIIDSKTNLSCASFIVMKKFGIGKPLQKGENIFTFTPTETGEIPFSCSMGMYRGKFIVID
jgi:sulfite exporter TauE/SafE/copper chaperone CopZ